MLTAASTKHIATLAAINSVLLQGWGVVCLGNVSRFPTLSSYFGQIHSQFLIWYSFKSRESAFAQNEMGLFVVVWWSE